MIVGLRAPFTPEGRLSERQRGDQRAAIAEQRRLVVQELKGSRFTVVHGFDTVPYVAMRLSAEALSRLENSGRAASLHVDVPVPPILAESTALVEATSSWAAGRSGGGQHVAVLDTGVQADHLFLQSSTGSTKVVSEACYSALAHCPGGVVASTAPGSGEPCTYSWVCLHGTHVAGISSGLGTASSGVAKDSGIISVQVFSNIDGCSPCSYTSDQMKGMERVSALAQTLPVAAVNMSLGGGYSSTNCDTDPRKAIIDTLRSQGVATVIASGNDGFSDGVSFPSCISSAITVGSTTKSDQVSSFSNSSSLVELLAPGSGIMSAVTDNTVPKDDQLSLNGTSMATPHVAGAFAVLKAAKPTATVAELLTVLESTGQPVTDVGKGNGVTKPRIRLLTAGNELVPPVRTTTTSYTGPSSGQYSDPVTLSATLHDTATRAGIASATLDFQLGTETTSSGPTAADGGATALLVPMQQPGAKTIAASFAGGTIGGAAYAASRTGELAFDVRREDCTLAYSGDVVVAPSQNTTLAADLGEPDSTPGDRSGKLVTFTVLDSQGGTQTFSATSGSTGRASTNVPLPSDTYQVTASFAGDAYYTSCLSPAAVVAVQEASAKATGGGWTAVGTGRTSFGFNVIPEAGGLWKGNLQVVAHGDRAKFRSRGAAAVTSVSATSMTWSGTGTWNGVANHRYTVQVQDNGASGGRKGDTISISVLSPTGKTVFSTEGSQRLLGGNLTVRQ